MITINRGFFLGKKIHTLQKQKQQRKEKKKKSTTSLTSNKGKCKFNENEKKKSNFQQFYNVEKGKQSKNIEKQREQKIPK